ncbi:MAG: class I SAM-dependent methyltransferase [Cyclobacteriaceae bacterium]|nr:class I SAM-dependent methyltransferase [Cyclobacteriaceae bacterium]
MKEKFNLLRLFIIAKTPFTIYLKYILTKMTNNKRKSFVSNQVIFKEQLSSKVYSIDWFTNQIPYWYEVFKRLNISFNDRLNILEIGSFEGVSSVFLLHTFPNSKLTCVDTWQGADEHQNLNMNKIEENFDQNTLPYGNRVTKYKGTSFNYFNDHDSSNTELFDIIYVDGSHFFDDVLIDALKSFHLLKVGRIIIFDDYLWSAYKDFSLNPASAINSFYKSNSKRLRVLSVYHQIIMQKTADINKTSDLVSLS